MIVRKNELELSFNDKAITLKGHLDEDCFRVFIESIETHPNLSQRERRRVRKLLSHEPNIIID